MSKRRSGLSRKAKGSFLKARNSPKPNFADNPANQMQQEQPDPQQAIAAQSPMPDPMQQQLDSQDPRKSGPLASLFAGMGGGGGY